VREVPHVLRRAPGALGGSLHVAAEPFLRVGRPSSQSFQVALRARGSAGPAETFVAAPMRESHSTSGTAAAAAAAVGAALVIADLARGRSTPMMTVMVMVVVMMMLTVVRQLRGVLQVAGRLACHLKPRDCRPR